jgi:hypothetical protein
MREQSYYPCLGRYYKIAILYQNFVRQKVPLDETMLDQTALDQNAFKWNNVFGYLDKMLDETTLDEKTWYLKKVYLYTHVTTFSTLATSWQQLFFFCRG